MRLVGIIRHCVEVEADTDSVVSGHVRAMPFVTAAGPGGLYPLLIE